MTMNVLRPLSVFLLPFCFAAQSSFAAAKPKNDYISRYLDIALMEKARSGIPVAITLAQGIYESGWGESRLATEALNHFGIKCGKYWQGPSFAQKDDDVDSTGTLVESCFRKYESPEHSYIDHTDFLLSGQRYEFLFGITNNDYRSWAWGLQNAGYATNPEYAKRLIKVVEDYELYKYDGLAYPLLEEETPFAVNDFEAKLNVPSSQTDTSVQPLATDEIMEIMPNAVISYNEDAIIREEDLEEIKKAEKIPDDYKPRNVPKMLFDLIFHHKKEVVDIEHPKEVEKQEEGTLSDIMPEKEVIVARGIASDNDGYIVNEFKVKNKFWLKN
jgi:hypothetical protein